MLRIRRKIEVVDGDRSISIEPSRDFRVSYAVDFDHPAIRRQEIDLGPLSPERFERDISAARTFGFLREVHALWDAGFARGGSLDNTVVLDDEKVVNPEGLRWSDEFVRHKVLDLCGDLALLGLPVCGRVRVERGGHEMHQRLVSAILAQPRRLDDRRRERGARARAGALVRRRRSHLIARPRGAPPSAPGARPGRVRASASSNATPMPALPLPAGRLQATWARRHSSVSSPGRWNRTTSGACTVERRPASPRTIHRLRASWRSPRRARPRCRARPPRAA